MPRTAKKPAEPSGNPFPYVSVKGGKLVCDFRGGDVRKYPGNKRGAIRLAEDLVEANAPTCMFSSSVTWAHQCGAKNLDYQELIGEHVGRVKVRKFMDAQIEVGVKFIKSRPKKADVGKFIKDIVSAWQTALGESL